jgi:hypothetical protein
MMRLGILLLGLHLLTLPTHAYRITARETSLVGTNSTTAPVVTWSRTLINSSGVSSAVVHTSGAGGRLSGLIQMERFAAGPSPVDVTRTFGSYIEENIVPETQVPLGSIFILTMTVGASGEGFVMPGPGSAGTSRLDLDVRLGTFSEPLIIGGSTKFAGGTWNSTMNTNSGIRRGEFQTRDGHISRAELEVVRPTSSSYSLYFAAQLSGEARPRTFVGAKAHVVGHMQVQFRLQVSTNNGASFVTIPWRSGNSNFLSAVSPTLSIERGVGENLISATGQPLSTNQLQFALSPLGPWNNLGAPFVFQDFEPVVIRDAMSDPVRFYRTVWPLSP